MKALISGIKRMEIHDGDGLRTTVFFKGCPLRCIWCHNPESLSFTPQIAYFKEKCIGCSFCVSVCAENVFKNHIPPFEPCSFCFKCIKECPTNALVGYGEEYCIEAVFSTYDKACKFVDEHYKGREDVFIEDWTIDYEEHRW